MTKIKNYIQDSNVSEFDTLIGTDSGTSRSTKTFSLASLKAFYTGELETDLTALEVIVTSQGVIITSQGVTIDTHQSNIVDLQATSVIHTNSILAIEGEQTEQNTLILANGTLSATNDGLIRNLSSSVDTNTGNIGTNTTNIGTNTGNIGTNTGNIGTNTTNIATNTATLVIHEADRIVFDNFKETLQDTTFPGIFTDITNLQTQYSGLGSVAYLDQTLQDQGVLIQTNITNISSNTGDIETVNIDLGNIGGRVTTLEGVVYTIDATQDGTDVDLELFKDSLSVSNITLEAGTNITLTNSGNNVTIDAANLSDNQDIVTNATNIATNVTNIATNIEEINRVDIGVDNNEVLINANTINIATNVSDIAQNVVDIAAGKALIDINATAIGDLQSSSVENGVGVKTLKFQVTRAELLALHETPLNILPTLPTAKMYSIESVSMVQPTGNAYYFEADTFQFWSSTVGVGRPWTTNFTQDDYDLSRNGLIVTNNASSNGKGAVSMPGSALRLNTWYAVAGIEGEGDFTFWLRYRIVDVS